MGSTYSEVVAAVKNRLLVVFDGDLVDDNIKDDDIDALILFLNSSDETRLACLLEFRQGVESAFHPTSKPVWEWSIFGVMIIRVNDVATIVGETRTVIDKLYNAFRPVDTRRLGGKAANSKISTIERPRAIKIGDTPYQFIPFIITVTTNPE